MHQKQSSYLTLCLNSFVVVLNYAIQYSFNILIGRLARSKAIKTSKDTIQQITLACSNRINFAIFVRLNPMQEIP
jgi:hypothetical protein